MASLVEHLQADETNSSLEKLKLQKFRNVFWCVRRPTVIFSRERETLSLTHACSMKNMQFSDMLGRKGLKSYVAFPTIIHEQILSWSP